MRADVLPWDFQPTETLSEQLRHDKQTRQDWYRNSTTSHYFYSTLEGANPNMRVSKENPPKWLHGFAADFDLPVPQERVDEAIARMDIKPTWVERSLSGNVRLIWLFPVRIPVESFDFAIYVLKQAVAWLRLGFLPGLDEAAFVDPARLLCNGCAWTRTDADAISQPALQSFYVECGRKFRFTPANSATVVPLDVVEKALKEKYPAFEWPGEFAPETQGPSFWIPNSLSPLSAILKTEGMFSFSAHADKPFYSWSDILGPEFVAQYVTKSIDVATREIYWDSKRFWRKIQNLWCSLDSPELQNHFKVTCKMSPKPGKDGLSLIDVALEHIYNNGRIAGAAPHLFRPPGLLEFQGRKVLNTYLHRVMVPAVEKTVWGPEGKFPFLSRHFDNLFDPPTQLPHFLSWWKHFYCSGVDLCPAPGQNTFLMGGVNVGKTLTSRAMVGRSVGGFCDASAFLINGGGFNSELLEAPLWCVDDETMGESSASQTNFQAMMKKTAANQQFQHNKKFEVGTTTEWMGRVLVTTNLDYISSRALGPMDNGSADKTNIFRCASVGKVIFPTRHELAKIIENELPYLLRWLIDWDPTTAGVVVDVRYGYAKHHEPGLLEQAHQGSKAAPFKELLFEALSDYFGQNKEAPAWRGSTTQLIRMITMSGVNDSIIRNLKLEQTNRYLEMIQREECIKCSVETGPLKTRVWVFPRFTEPAPAPEQPVITPSPIVNIFSKNL